MSIFEIIGIAAGIVGVIIVLGLLIRVFEGWFARPEPAPHEETHGNVVRLPPSSWRGR